MLTTHLASYSINKDSPLNEWEFIGGDSLLRKLIFVNKCPDEPLPPNSNYCICSSPIKANNYLRNVHTKEIVIVGEKCLQKFLGNDNNLKIKRTNRLCDRCKVGHNNRSDNWCNICRGGVLKVGRHKNKSFRWVYNNDRSYCNRLMIVGNPCDGLIPFLHWLKRIDKEDSKDLSTNRKRSRSDRENKHINFTKKQRRINKVDDSHLSKVDLHHRLGNSLLNFGKHMGKSFHWVHDYDDNYCKWVLRQRRLQGQLLDFQRWLNECLD